MNNRLPMDYLDVAEYMLNMQEKYNAYFTTVAHVKKAFPEVSSNEINAMWSMLLSINIKSQMEKDDDRNKT